VSPLPSGRTPTPPRGESGVTIRKAEDDASTLFESDYPDPPRTAIEPMLDELNRRAHGFVKHDGDKSRLDLIPPEFVELLGRSFMHGAKKYSDHNWRKGAEWSRYYGALLRHLNAWNAGEDIDADSGLPHLANAGACIAILAASQASGLGVDDRWRKP